MKRDNGCQSPTVWDPLCLILQTCSPGLMIKWDRIHFDNPFFRTGGLDEITFTNIS